MKKELRRLVAENCRRLEGSDKTLASVYEVMFRLGDAVLAEYDDGFRVQKTTYAQAKARIEEASAALREKIGATHGYIGLEMENSVDWIVAFWAILRSGNKPWLVNTRHPKSLSERIRRDLGVSVILCAVPGALEATYLPVSELTGAAPCPPDFEDEFALATSATSLNEIVCFYTGRQVTAQLLNTKGILRDSKRVAFHYHGSLKLLAFLPFYHIFGLFAVYFWFTYFGRTLVFLRDYSPDTILSTCRKQEVTHLFAVPLLWHTVEKQVQKELDRQGEKATRRFWRGIRLGTALQQVAPYAGAKLARRLMREVTDRLFGRSIQFCISGGSFLRPSALAMFNGMGYPLHNGYGMSEVGITSVELGVRPKERNRNAVGKPFDNVAYRLDEAGVLSVKGEAVCADRMINGERRPMGEWYATGDRFAADADGRYTVLGRVSDVVIGENGENVDPDRIEEGLTLPEAANFCVLGLGEGADETLSLVVQVSPYLSGERLRAL
ncbi:MAG: AMP-binding protein, partial [Clostridia bacterium]|nr:AMP-binding protein [Clostridia bacterium]